MEKTLGERRVRTEFNPAKSDMVEQIKQKTAELINLLATIRDQSEYPGPNGTVLIGVGEKSRLASIAMTEYESAAMWAVKAATA